MSKTAIHSSTRDNIETITKAGGAVCISCLGLSDTSDISEFVDGGRTGICPLCGTDALLPAQTPALLKYLHLEYFGHEESGGEVRAQNEQVNSDARPDKVPTQA